MKCNTVSSWLLNKKTFSIEFFKSTAGGVASLQDCRDCAYALAAVVIQESDG
jgi:hypothetical protein